MPFSILERDGKFNVVNTKTGKTRASYANQSNAEIFMNQLAEQERSRAEKRGQPKEESESEDEEFKADLERHTKRIKEVKRTYIDDPDNPKTHYSITLGGGKEQVFDGKEGAIKAIRRHLKAQRTRYGGV
jgi:hypothetical protein